MEQEEDKIVTGGMAKTLQIYDLQRPDAAPQVLSPTCSDSIKTALYRPDGNTIVSVEDKLLRSRSKLRASCERATCRC